MPANKNTLEITTKMDYIFFVRQRLGIEKIIRTQGKISREKEI
jgi:hypothetical protein